MHPQQVPLEMEIDVSVHLFSLAHLDEINVLLSYQISEQLYHAAAADDGDVHHKNDVFSLSIQT